MSDAGGNETANKGANREKSAGKMRRRHEPRMNEPKMAIVVVEWAMRLRAEARIIRVDCLHCCAACIFGRRNQAFWVDNKSAGVCVYCWWWGRSTMGCVVLLFPLRCSSAITARTCSPCSGLAYFKRHTHEMIINKSFCGT